MTNKVTKVSTGPITGLLKPRYKEATVLLGELYNPSNGVDIFIDFNTFIHALAGYQKYLNYLPFSGEENEVEIDIISSILTTLNHWKNFAKKWDNVRVIGIMNAFEMDKLAESKYLKSYLVPHMHKFQHDRYKQFKYYFEESVKKVQAILKYVPNMYLIQCTEFDSYVLPNLLCDYHATGRSRIIISGNSLMTGYHNLHDTKVIYRRYRKNGMESVTDPIMIVQSITKVNEDIVEEFTKNEVFYNLLNVIVGDFDRGIVGLTQLGLTTFACNLMRGIEQYKIPDNPKSIESVLPVIDKVYHDYVLKSYPLVDIIQHSAMVPPSAIEHVKADMIDLIDIDGLRSLSIDGLNLLELL